MIRARLLLPTTLIIALVATALLAVSAGSVFAAPSGGVDAAPAAQATTGCCDLACVAGNPGPVGDLRQVTCLRLLKAPERPWAHPLPSAIALASEPSSDVTVNLQNLSLTDMTVPPTTLTFRPEWDQYMERHRRRSPSLPLMTVR